jgi:hypothetical protein
MKLLIDSKSCYLILGPVFHKTMEAGFQFRLNRSGGLDAYWRFRTRGDHAGLTCYLQLWSLLVELMIHDNRHWNWEQKRFRLPAED